MSDEEHHGCHVDQCRSADGHGGGVFALACTWLHSERVLGDDRRGQEFVGDVADQECLVHAGGSEDREVGQWFDDVEDAVDGEDGEKPLEDLTEVDVGICNEQEVEGHRGGDEEPDEQRA